MSGARNATDPVCLAAAIPTRKVVWSNPISSAQLDRSDDRRITGNECVREHGEINPRPANRSWKYSRHAIVRAKVQNCAPYAATPAGVDAPAGQFVPFQDL